MIMQNESTDIQASLSPVGWLFLVLGGLAMLAPFYLMFVFFTA